MFNFQSCVAKFYFKQNQNKNAIKYVITIANKLLVQES